jgi:hypothetical protein
VLLASIENLNIVPPSSNPLARHSPSLRENILNIRKDFKFVGYLWRLCLLPHISMTVSDKSVRMGNTAVLSNFEAVYCQIICLDGIGNVIKTSGKIICLGQKFELRTCQIIFFRK